MSDLKIAVIVSFKMKDDHFKTPKRSRKKKNGVYTPVKSKRVNLKKLKIAVVVSSKK